MFKNIYILVLAASILVMCSCASNESSTIIYSSPDSEVIEEAPASAIEEQTLEELLLGSDPFVRQRILADMLYEARVAFDDNRLMAPAGDNAFDGFRAILDFDPENEIALQGMRDIVQRYVELADAAIKLGQYDNAEDYLYRGIRVGESRALINDAMERLAQARRTKMDIFTLDPEALENQSLEIMVELGEIGEYIRDIEATFLINARSDEEGRWIYKIMREAVGGYRLRGNIGVANEPSIQVVVPKT